jgi:hypothetical protein
MKIFVPSEETVFSGTGQNGTLTDARAVAATSISRLQS